MHAGLNESFWTVGRHPTGLGDIHDSVHSREISFLFYLSPHGKELVGASFQIDYYPTKFPLTSIKWDHCALSNETACRHRVHFSPTHKAFNSFAK